MKKFHLHLVSDSTGETVSMVARACLVQFEGVEVIEHMWPMVRSVEKVKEIIAGIRDNPGFVLYSFVNEEIQSVLEEGCHHNQVPCVAVLDPVIAAMGRHLEAKIQTRPGSQHVMDAEYFDRIEAMQFTLNHDDGQSTWDLDAADVIVLGVSRTSKTPTCMYLANRGLKAANIPIVPGCPIPDELFTVKNPLIVGLTKDPRRLVEIRQQRLKLLDNDQNSDYVDLQLVSDEVNDARRLYTKHGWKTINVSRKSIEETAATIIQHYTRRHEHFE